MTPHLENSKLRCAGLLPAFLRSLAANFPRLKREEHNAETVEENQQLQDTRKWEPNVTLFLPPSRRFYENNSLTTLVSRRKSQDEMSQEPRSLGVKKTAETERRFRKHKQ
jgi:hypothetical protein